MYLVGEPHLHHETYGVVEDMHMVKAHCISLNQSAYQQCYPYGHRFSCVQNLSSSVGKPTSEGLCIVTC